MSPQIIELLIFAAIAFYIINKLISILGTTDEDSRYKDSKFGEPSGMKDVTESSKRWNVVPNIHNIIKQKAKINPDYLAYPENKELSQNLQKIESRIEKFSPEIFVKNSKKALKFIIEAMLKKDHTILEDLVDKRYLESLLDKASGYEEFHISDKLESKISDVTFFGNNIIIRVIFTQDGFKEEWTFTRSAIQNDKTWYLSNIEREVLVN